MQDRLQTDNNRGIQEREEEQAREAVRAGRWQCTISDKQDSALMVNSTSQLECG
jgi:hypothetical protein